MVLHDINAKAERLGHLISDLMALARGDEGKTVFEREPVTVVGDEARMIQVIMNLLDNAICYTHPGGRVSLTVEARQGAGARTTARVIPTIHAAPLLHMREAALEVGSW